MRRDMQNGEFRMQNAKASRFHSAFCILHSAFVRRRAFTLIETMLVILLMALLASAVTLSFARPLRAARAQDAIEMVRSFDGMCRQVARRFGQPVTLTYDLSEGRIVRR